MKRRDWLLAAPALALAPRVRADNVPARPGEVVIWPATVPLLDGGVWAPAPGQAAVVVFWSTTCPFCKRHNVHMDKLHRALAGRPASVLGVARDRDPEAVRRYMAQQGYDFPVTMAWREMAAALTPRNMIPLTVTVDRQGRLREVIPGEMFEDDVMKLASLAS
jgi:thiol-disulfide isomerase/thioredoxin